MSYKKKANNAKKSAATAKGGKTPIESLLNSAEILESMKKPASSSGIRLPIPQAGLSKQYNVTRTASATTGTKIKQNTSSSSSSYAPPAKRQRAATNTPSTNVQGNMQNAPVRGTYSKVTRYTNPSLPAVNQKTSLPQHANTSTKVALPAPNNSSQIIQKGKALPTRKNPSRSASHSPASEPKTQMVPVPQKFKPKESKDDKISKANSIVKDDAIAPSTSPSDIYDAMIGEISNLLQAAQEAQAFGRMKMSATYQLLAHTRLVGLGKRFDGFLVHNKNGLEPSIISGSMTPLPVSPTTTPSSKMQSKQPRVLKFPDDASSKPHPSNNSKTATSRKPNAKDIQDAQESLSKILPTGVDLDDSMMEHLARAAMELHNKRTGKGLLHERQENKQPAPKPPITKHAITNLNNIVASTHMEQPGGVAWTEVEKRKFFEGVHIFGDTNANAIAAHIGTRTSTEVKSHLRNMSARTRIEIQITTPIEEQITKKEAEKNLEQKREGDNEDQVSSTTKLRRGKKSGSRAMLTVANPVFDAKKMVQGKI